MKPQGRSKDGSGRTERSTYDRALHLLGFRARSVQELRRSLIQKGEPAEDVQHAIERLLDQRLLNDDDFARAYARSKITGGGASRLRVLQELSRRGVARDVADRAMAELERDEGIVAAETIHRVAAKKWRSLAKLDAQTRRQRVYGFLARRGYAPDEIREALAALGDDSADSDA
jgi:regulatory protein